MPARATFVRINDADTTYLSYLYMAWDAAGTPVAVGGNVLINGNIAPGLQATETGSDVHDRIAAQIRADLSDPGAEVFFFGEATAR